MNYRQIAEVLTWLGKDAHPAEVEVTADRQVRVVVRPKHSSRTFVLQAKVQGAVEL